jgi:sulfoxide reductase heme-binding subunit YedZ
LTLWLPKWSVNGLFLGARSLDYILCGPEIWNYIVGGRRRASFSRREFPAAAQKRIAASLADNKPQTRFQRRLSAHLALFAVSVLLCLVFMYLFPRRDLISRLSIGTAYAALLLTVATMLLGPWNVLRRSANPVSFDLRRDLGIWSGILAVLHTVVGLNVHLRGRPWLYFVNDHHKLRRDLFGFGNYTGLVAALVFALVLAISNDLSLRRLGKKQWKFLQRWVYAAILLTAIHAWAYQQIEKRVLPFQMATYGVLGLLLLLQSAAFHHIRQGRTRRAIQDRSAK